MYNNIETLVGLIKSNNCKHDDLKMINEVYR
jgi:hypothetical protein